MHVIQFVHRRAHLEQTHNTTLARPIADFIIEVKDGRIVWQGSAKDVIISASASPEGEEEVSPVDTGERAHTRSHEVTAPGDQTAGFLIKKEAVSQGEVSRTTSTCL
jgi:ABC-type glutathione transport system ATPase component